MWLDLPATVPVPSPGPRVQLRRVVTARDVHDWADVHGEVFGTSSAALAEVVRHPSSGALVAVLDGAPVGVVSTARADGVAVLFHCGVVPGARGQGIGPPAGGGGLRRGEGEAASEQLCGHGERGRDAPGALARGGGDDPGDAHGAGAVAAAPARRRLAREREPDQGQVQRDDDRRHDRRGGGGDAAVDQGSHELAPAGQQDQRHQGERDAERQHHL